MDVSMSAYNVTLIPGDGIGPEVTEATRRVLEATGIGFTWDYQEAGLVALERHGDLLPEATLDSVRKNKIGLKGPITTPLGTGFRSVNVGLRQALGLYANLRPAKTIKGVQSTFDDIDLVVVRENLEGMYSGIEFDTGTPEAAEVIAKINSLSSKPVDPAAAISIKVMTEKNTRNIIKFAFEYARANGRKKVTIVHKANIMKFTDGLFLREAQAVAERYPEIAFNDRIVDNMCMQLMQKPGDYDVMVMENLFGDVVSDLTAGMVGGLGLAPGANFGANAAVFEPTHGSAPKYTGQNKVNPMAMMLSGVLMLRHLEEREAAGRLENAIADVIRAGERLTYDMKPSRDDPTAVGTSDVADAIIDAMGARV